MRSIEILALIFIAFLGYYGILQLENQVIAGIYFSFESLYSYSGWTCFALLFIGLWIPKPYGRIFGLLAFVVACWHILVFLHLDFGLNFKLIVQKILSEIPLIIGAFAFLLMCFVAFVSLMQKFRVYKMVICVYGILCLVLLHILTLQKVLTPLYYVLICGVIFTLCLKIWKRKKC